MNTKYPTQKPQGLTLNEAIIGRQRAISLSASDGEKVVGGRMRCLRERVGARFRIQTAHGDVLANASMSSNQFGEAEIRKSIIEADLVDCTQEFLTE
jgi:hypothetical protein